MNVGWWRWWWWSCGELKRLLLLLLWLLLLRQRSVVDRKWRCVWWREGCGFAADVDRRHRLRCVTRWWRSVHRQQRHFDRLWWKRVDVLMFYLEYHIRSPSSCFGYRNAPLSFVYVLGFNKHDHRTWIRLFRFFFRLTGSGSKPMRMRFALLLSFSQAFARIPSAAADVKCGSVGRPWRDRKQYADTARRSKTDCRPVCNGQAMR